MHVFLQFNESGFWVLPGGRVENEFSAEAAYRELKEEHPSCEYGEDEFCQEAQKLLGTDWQTFNGLTCHDSLYINLYNSRLGLRSKTGESKYLAWASFQDCYWLFQEKLIPKNIFEDIIKGFVEFYKLQETTNPRILNLLEEYTSNFFYQLSLPGLELFQDSHSLQ